jgi:RNA polymerase sigma factor (sigma-70 family)
MLLAQDILLTEQELNLLIRGCALNNRESQKKLYHSFYGYAMSVCSRYINTNDDGSEILNDGFLKVFKEIHQFTPTYADILSSFKGWLRKIMIYTAIDHFRKNQKYYDASSGPDASVISISDVAETPLDKISFDEIIRFIQELSPGYRTVLNLFVVEGFSHDEIAKQLGISVGTSKSNLAKARKQLQNILARKTLIKLAKNAG